MARGGVISWQTPVWVEQTSEDAEELDEPPELKCSPQRFRRAPVSKPCEKTSLLTKAIMGISDDDHEPPRSCHFDYQRRRSMASNMSVASTTDLTSDTGFTSPARTNTPSPPIPDLLVSRLNSIMLTPKPKHDYRHHANGSLKAHDTITEEPKRRESNAPRKRSIQFACGIHAPLSQAGHQTSTKSKSDQEAPRRPCIKFACQNVPTSDSNSHPHHAVTSNRPATPKKISPVTADSPSTPRQPSARKMSAKHGKFLRASSTDLTNDAAHFHEFACGANREEDWIRQDNRAAKCKLTIHDTLVKENHFRQLAKEAEMEDEEEEGDDDDLEDEEEDDDDEYDDDYDNNDDDDDGDDEVLGLSDGYRTDEESGFAASDDSEAEEEGGNMVMWTLSKSPAMRPATRVPAIPRRLSLQGHSSDSSDNGPRRSKMRRIKPIDVTPDLPDSTDFVCGTLDEDRHLEEAYVTRMAARRNEKLRVIPQDIDPSFPASDPEDEDDEDIYNPVHRDSDDDFELPGEMEDLHHGQDRSRRRRKSEHTSPRKFHSPPPKKRHVSPPPKRHYSPPPKSRMGRSPKPLFGAHSLRQIMFPTRNCLTTPMGSPKAGNHVKFNLAARPVTMTTKSMPRSGVVFSKQCRNRVEDRDDLHVRGAIDIVKGLERKRQRRKEKFYQKYCNRARRGQIPERKPQPGRGAERMKELGLLMAGKKDQGNYVISI